MDSPPQGGIHRVVTDHNKDGKAVVRYDDEQAMFDVTPEHATFSVVWATDSSPINNIDERDGAQKPVWSGKLHNENGGSVLRFVDFPPHVQSPMHRTQSLDYGIVIWGEIELELDSGETKTLKQSEVCVQRGTNHIWRNKTDQWTRMAYVLLDAQPVTVNGEKLPDKGFVSNGNH